MKRPPLLLPFAVAAALLCAAPPGAANGQFPSAGQLVVNRADPKQLALRTTFGIVVTRDGGVNWDWICEDGAHYSVYEPPIAVTAAGSVFAALLAGVTVAHGDLCDFALVGGPIAGANVPDVSVAPFDPSLSVAITNKPNAYWESSDDAVTWNAVGAPLPSDFFALTLDVAPSDPSRIYATGLSGPTGMQVGAVARSIDHAASWTVLPIPSSDATTAPYLGAIDPTNPDRAYVRLDGAAGRLVVTSDGGGTWNAVFTGTGFLQGLALSPDGSKLLVGGEIDGIWRAPTDTLAFAKASQVGARCLAWSQGTVYACAIESADGFMVGTSTDDGSTFAPLLHMPCVRGPIACADSTSVGKSCPMMWPFVAKQLGVAKCAGLMTASSTTASAGAGASSSTANAAGGAGGASATGIPSAQPSSSTIGGCGCRAGGDGAPAPGAVVALAALAAIRRRRLQRG